MTAKSNLAQFRLAATGLVVSAGLHLIGCFVSGFSPQGQVLLPVVVFYSVLAVFLWRGVRWLGYFVFLCMLIGAIGSWIASGSADSVPVWIYAAISIIDVVVAVVLFLALWRSAARPGSSTT